MKKIYLIILIILLLITTITTCTFVYIREKNNDTTIPTDYIIVFKNESAEIVNTTYVYEVIKKKKKTYKYINTTSTTGTYDSVTAEEKITKKGSTKKKKKIFEIAKKHNAYSYVKDIKEDKIYSIDEYKEIFK